MYIFLRMRESWADSLFLSNLLCLFTDLSSPSPPNPTPPDNPAGIAKDPLGELLGEMLGDPEGDMMGEG